MLTPILERCLLKGKAQYNVYTQGMQSGAIVVPADKTIVITDIWYYHFVDAEAGETSNNEPWNRASVHQISFASKDKRDFFMIRETLLKTRQNGVESKSVFGQSHFDTYLIHTKDIYIDITRFVPPSDWVSVGITQPPTVPEYNPPKVPIGRGKPPNSFAAVSTYNITGTKQIRDFPMRPFDPGITEATNQLENSEDASTALIDPNLNIDGSGMMNFPIVNVGYVTLNSKIGEEIF